MLLNLPMTHNHIRGGHISSPEWVKEGKLINVYLANKGVTWMVEFQDVGITNYSKKVTLPYEVTEEYLESIYDDAYDYLHNYLLVDVAKIKLGTMKQKHKEIKELEQKLKKLKGLI